MDDIQTDQLSLKKWEEEQYNNPTDEDGNPLPTNQYREASLKLMKVLHSALATATENDVNMWGVFFALSHPYCIGRTMSDVATEIGVSRASISNAAINFCKANNLPPSIYMRGLNNQ